MSHRGTLLINNMINYPAVKVRLSNVTSDVFSVWEPDEQFISSFDENLMKVGIGVNFSHSENKKSLTVHLSFSYDYDAGRELPFRLLAYEGAFEFVIADFDENVSSEDNNLNVNDTILITLLGISISTARGIIIAKSAGNFINKYYLPIFDPKRILQDLREV